MFRPRVSCGTCRAGAVGRGRRYGGHVQMVAAEGEACSLASWVRRCRHLSSQSTTSAAASTSTELTAVTNALRWATWAPSVRPLSYIQKVLPVVSRRVRSLLSAELYTCQQFSQQQDSTTMYPAGHVARMRRAAAFYARSMSKQDTTKHRA